MKNFQTIRKIAALLICGILVFGGCGKDGAASNADNPSAGSPGKKNDAVSDTRERMAYKDDRYLPEFTDLSKRYEAGGVKGLGVAGDTFYLVESSYSGYAATGSKLIAYSPDSGEERILWDDTGADMQMIAAAPLEDGSYIVLGRIGDAAQGAVYRLNKMNAAGEEVFSAECQELSIPEGESSAKLAVDAQGRCYLLAGGNVMLFDEQGKAAGKIDLNGRRAGNIACGNNGKVYIYEIMTNSLIPLDFETAGLGTDACTVFAGVGNVMGTTKQADFLLCDGMTVYRYNCETGEATPLFDLLDSQIPDASGIETIGEMEDGRIFIFREDGIQGITEAALLTRKPLAECTDKQVITMGTVLPGRDLMDNVANFNRLDEDFSISVINYRMGGRSLSEAKDALVLDISTGLGPDICVLDYLDGTEALFAGGFLADLSARLDNGGQYQKEDFIPQALDAYTYQDKLMAIPKYFKLQTIAGKSDVVGTSMGWDRNDLQEMVRSHPDAGMVFDDRDSLHVLDMCIGSILEEFVDPDKNKADFESSEYIEFLEFLKELPDRFNENEYLIYGNEWLREEQALLSCREICRFTDLQVLKVVFGSEYTCIGYPAAGKKPDTILKGCNIYAISADSSEADRAWRFIEWANSTQGEETYDAVLREGFPTRKDVFEQEVKAATGELGKGKEPRGSMYFSDGTGVEFRRAEPDEIQVIYALIESARPEKGAEQTILEIMKEEAAYLFDGSKSADEVAEVIQNRVQVYLDEGHVLEN